MTSPVDRVVVEADGGARGNPGPAGYGAVVRDPDSGQVLAERFGALGVTTNNVAEYRGLLAGLAAAAELGARAVEVRMDSKLVVEQMSGRWQIKHPGLRPLAAEAAALIRRFDSVRFVWVPRERNKHADALANKAMDTAARTSGQREDRSARTSGGRTVAEPGAEREATTRTSWEPPTGTATRLLLVRHGATELTAQRRYSGRGDVPLSDRGRQQADRVAARLAAFGTPVSAVLTSPLTRCVETAERIADALGGPPVRVEPDLVECDFGDWEGMTFAEVRQRWPEQMSAWLASTSVAPPGGESFQAVAKRVRGLTARLRDGYTGQNLVLVSHVTPVKLLLRDALAAGDAFLHRLYLDPAGLSIVDLWSDGPVSVRTVNDTAHLV
ncbi:MAG TPA: bifunctional RNase H/acid phosphatase [Micromonosporaceae bacterium]